MDNNKLAAVSAHSSLSEEKAVKDGAGKWLNIKYLLTELDNLYIQERQALKPVDETFLTTSQWWYYLERGAKCGAGCGLFFFIIRAIHVALGFVIVDSVNNAVLYMVSAWFVFKLSTYVLKRITYHHGATTKAIGLVFQGGIGGIVLFAVLKSYGLFMLIFYRTPILEWSVSWDTGLAESVNWGYIHILGPGYVEICFMLSVMIGGAAAFANFNLLKKDLEEDSKRGRPYNRVSVDQ